MNTLVKLGTVLAFLGVALGAFGAHALRDRLGPAGVATYRTGTEYHLVHALAILVLSALAGRALDERRAIQVGLLFTAGILLFSGSLYALAITGVRALGAITPLGGLCFLSGWAVLFSSVRNSS